ncbi:hypothetical protein [Gottfriedia solisilvae]|uniref:hypothetical protein n=1 Tax=Gottfriedia solisilvae TaxID=1516104 RepID=UPI003D2EA311
MRQFHTSTKKMSTLLLEKENKPGPLVIKNLTKNSLSNVFDEAKNEWEYLEGIDTESPYFVENCELCNSRLHLENHIIKNINTEKRLRIGSDCIKRFVQFAGTSSQESSNTYFEIIQNERKLETEVRMLFKNVVIYPLPTYREANKFRKTFEQLLESKGINYLCDKSEGRIQLLKDIFKIENPTLEEQIKFKDFIDGKTAVQRENRKYRDFIKEGESWGKRRRVTSVSLSTSKVYSDPSKKYN